MVLVKIASVIGAFAIAALALSSSSAAPKSMCSAPPKALLGLKDAKVTKLERRDAVVGKGAEAKKGKLVQVHYIGRLTNGTKFDASCDRGEPFEFTLGASQVIRGWDEGVAGMKIGGQRRLIIPSNMGYGPNGAGGVIPPNAALIFDVELIAVK
jgi:FKBP-type peptidyl-prolyl cis-trans isomerase